MFRNHLIACGALLALSACGSGGSSGGPAPATVSRNTPAVGWRCTETFCRVTYSENELSIPELPIDEDLSHGDFVGAGSSSGEMLFGATTTFAETSSTASVALIRDELDGTGVLYSRTGETTLPQGLVYYEGEYVGLVTNAENNNVIYIINGNASLSVDFGEAEVYGAIGSRTVFGPTGDAAIGVTSDHVVFYGPADSQGLYSGVTSGGDINALSTTDAQAGTFSGLVAGPNGDTSVGGLEFVHSLPGVDYLEVGAFSMSLN